VDGTSITTVSLTLWGIAIVWFSIALVLAGSGLLAEIARFVGPFVFVPPLALVTAFALSPRVRAWAFAFDTRTLVSVQALRVVGASFLAVYAVGQLDGAFALWAGLLDCIVGFSALFAAQCLTPVRTAMQRWLLIGWMALGIVDFLVAVPLARMARATDPASLASIARLPLSLITTFFVPVALMAYFLLGAHLWRQRKA
jgi:hypothetical protein